MHPSPPRRKRTAWQWVKKTWTGPKAAYKGAGLMAALQQVLLQVFKRKRVLGSRLGLVGAT